MKKFFTISKKQITILITLLVLSTAALWYYLAFIPNNEQALDEQHFRWLQNTDKNIRDKIVANDTLLSNLLQAYIQDTSKINYIKNYYVPNTTLSAYTTPLKTDSNASGKKSASAKSPVQTAKDQPDTCSVQFVLSWDSVMNKLILSANKEVQETGFKYTVLMNYDFEKFIEPLLIQGLFDHYVIFYEGSYIYEDFHSGLGYNAKDEDSLLKTGKAMTGANIINQKVGGVNYQIFLQPINFFNGKKLIIAGLLSQQKIDTEKKQLPPGIAVLAITIALGILLFLPWIKIHFQGKYDRVNLRDAGESVLVAKLLMALVVLLFFTYNTSFRPIADAHSKTDLANAIGSAFTQEVNSAYACLTKFDAVMKQDSMFYDVSNLRTNSIKLASEENENHQKKYLDTLRADSILQNFCSGTQYFVVNWLDSNGKVKYNWTTLKQNDIHANYGDRDYFKNISNNNTISLEPGTNHSFALAQVISRTSGTFRTIICKKSFLDDTAYKQNRAKAVTLSFTIKSLDSIIMPAGYSFAIIDNGGNVKYDSKPERNLNENLLDEFSNREELDDALEGRFKEVFQTKYYEGDYSVLAKPLTGLPYFIVIMSDNSFPASVQIETFSFTWGMVLLFLIVVALDLFVLIIASARRSLFKKQYFVTSWLWPRANSQYEYRIATTANVIMIIILIGVFWFHPFHLFNYLSYLFVLIFCVPLSTIFLNTVFLYKYKENKNEVYFRYKVRGTCWSIIFLAILNVFAIAALSISTWWQVFGFEIVMILIGWLLIQYYKSHSSKNQYQSSQKKNFVQSYTFMIFTRLIITSAIPAVFFYTASYNFETNLLARYTLYDYAMQLKQKFPGEQYPDSFKYSNAIYTDGAWVKNIGTVKNCALCDSSEKKCKLSATEKNTAHLFNFFGFYIDDISNINNDNFYLSSSYDKYFCFDNFFNSALYHDRGNTLCINKGNNTVKNHLRISSGNLNYSFPSIIPGRGFMFWILLAATLLGFAFTLGRVIKKVCSLDLDKIQLWKETDKLIQQLFTSTQHQLIWITGLPTNELAKQVKAEIELNNETISLDFDDIIIDDTNTPWNDTKSNLRNNRRKFIIALHIENNLDDIKITTEKFECIKTALDQGKKVIVISAIHPLKLYEILNRKTDAGKSIQDGAIANLINTVLNNSDVITLPLIENNYTGANENISSDAEANNKALYMFLNEETKYTEFLKGLRTALLLQGIETETKRFQGDRLTLKIQSLANNFYMGIWRSLSSDEKFILHDLASDGLVNITNTFAVSLLMNKGLIIEEDGHLHIFNRSFRNFIVSSVDDKELGHLQMLHSKHSNWSNLQGPLLLIVLAVFIFLAIAQEGLYSKVIGIISGMAAGIPALLKLLSMVNVQNGKEVKTEQPAE